MTNERLGPLRQDPRGGIKAEQVTRLESIGGVCVAVVIGALLACAVVAGLDRCALTSAGVVCKNLTKEAK